METKDTVTMSKLSLNLNCNFDIYVRPEDEELQRAIMGQIIKDKLQEITGIHVKQCFVENRNA